MKVSSHIAAMAKTKTIDEIWADAPEDRKTRAKDFARIVTSETNPKVISIEAGFGEGKTFFRERWAEHLKMQGETVIQFDAWKSDHSGDPLLAFMGALLRGMPSKEKTRTKKVVGGITKAGGFLVKGATRYFFKETAEDVFDHYFGDEENNLRTSLEEMAKETEKPLSSAAASLLIEQISRERVREEELPAQLDKIREGLTGKTDGRVIVLIDELDRCRPDYAISLLEAIKHLFDHPGFVFVLFVNNDQLERTAKAMFGEFGKGEERYLAKFIDLRLSLGPLPRKFLCQKFAETLKYKPWNGHEVFSLDSVISAATKAANRIGVTPRQLATAFKNADLAMRINEGPLDGPILITYAIERSNTDFLDHPPSLDNNLFPRIDAPRREILEEIKASFDQRDGSVNNSSHMIENFLCFSEYEKIEELYEAERHEYYHRFEFRILEDKISALENALPPPSYPVDHFKMLLGVERLLAK